MPFARPPVRRPSHPRAGFTLVELLVVIVVIAILVGLLIPAVNGVYGRARVTQVVTELSSLDASLVSFKGKYGVEVPSFFVLCEEGDDWLTDWTSTPPASLPANITDAHRRASVAFIRQVWPGFIVAGAPGTMPDIDFNGNGAPGDIVVLDGSECLVFFLGGVFSRGTNTASLADDVLIGFAANPSNPFEATSSNNRVGPFYESFVLNRFVDGDMDGMPEYIDPLPGQTKPYIYVSSKGGTGYTPYGLDGIAATVEDNELPLDPNASPAAPLIDDIYYQDDGSGGAGPPLNPQTYQIISAGIDADFGVGGAYDGKAIDVQTNPARIVERDNITNFKKQRLD